MHFSLAGKNMTKDISTTVDQAILTHGVTGDALIPILHEINNAFGYIPNEAFKIVKEKIQAAKSRTFVSESQLYGLASFYHMLSTQPLGRHVIRYCESAPCHVMGGRQVVQALIEHLGIKPGESSKDNHWSLMNTSCLGVCGVGPVIMVDEDIYGNVLPEQVPAILSKYD